MLKNIIVIISLYVVQLNCYAYENNNQPVTNKSNEILVNSAITNIEPVLPIPLTIEKLVWAKKYLMTKAYLAMGNSLAETVTILIKAVLIMKNYHLQSMTSIEPAIPHPFTMLAC